MFSTKSLLAALLATTMLAAPALAQVNSTEVKKTHNAYADIGTDPDAKADSDMRDVLKAQASLNPKPIETLTPEEARQQPTPADGAKLVMKQKGMSTAPDASVTTKDIMIGTNKARVYTPAGATGALPVVVYYHGGGWVIADIDTYDASPRAIAKMANAIVVSAEYRHAPEHKFPAAHEDAFAAYQWVLKNAASIGGDSSRVAVMGESAGGNLAVNTAIAARDQHVQLPVAIVAVYPVAGNDMMTKSYVENEFAKPLNKAMMKWFVKYTINTPKDLDDPRINLVGDKANLVGLPYTVVITDEIDPLRSEGQLLADKLRAAGVQVDSKNYSGVTHEFFGMGMVVAKAKQAEDQVATDLKAAFNATAPKSN